MKTNFPESDGVWQDTPFLLHGGNRSPHSVSAVVELGNEIETPNSTVTAEQGKHFVYRLKAQNAYQKQLSWTGMSNCPKYAADGSPTPLYKTMKHTKIFPGRIRKRVVLKNGNVNLSKEHVEKRSQRYLQVISIIC